MRNYRYLRQQPFHLCWGDRSYNFIKKSANEYYPLTPKFVQLHIVDVYWGDRSHRYLSSSFTSAFVRK
nr:hypothetical protein [Nostoc sp. ChiQUE02]